MRYASYYAMHSDEETQQTQSVISPNSIILADQCVRKISKDKRAIDFTIKNKTSFTICRPSIKYVLYDDSESCIMENKVTSYDATLKPEEELMLSCVFTSSVCASSHYKAVQALECQYYVGDYQSSDQYICSFRTSKPIEIGLPTSEAELELFQKTEDQTSVTNDEDSPDSASNGSGVGKRIFTKGGAIGEEIPPGIYKIVGRDCFRGDTDYGGFLVNTLGPRHGGWLNGSGDFRGSVYAELEEGKYLQFTWDSYAVRLEDVEVNLRTSVGSIGWYRAGTDCAAGTYRLTRNDKEYFAEYYIYTTARLPRNPKTDIRESGSIYNDEDSVVITLNEGEYLSIHGINANLID